MNDAKSTVRKEMRERRHSLTPKLMEQAEAITRNSVRCLDEWKKAQTVFSYINMPLEMGTGALVDDCLKSGKQLYVPAFRQDKGCYEPTRHTGGAVIQGLKNVPEPAEKIWLEDQQPAHKIDLALVPGLAFDRKGFRVGYGGGHYDRMLITESLKSAFKIGLAFEFQVVDFLAHDSHDIKIQALVTEKNFYRFDTKS